MRIFPRVHKITIFLAAVGCTGLTLLLGFTELPWILSKPLIVHENIKTSPVIVVLYSNYGDAIENELDKYSSQRVQKAVQLWKKGFAPFIIFSGGSAARKGNALPGALRMAREAGKQGVPREQIIVEHHSKDTRHNVLNSSRILIEKSWNALILVTNDFHMKRAVSLFEKRGFQVYPAPIEWHPRGEWKANFGYLRILLYELVARVAYVLLNDKQIDTLINFLRPSRG